MEELLFHVPMTTILPGCAVSARVRSSLEERKVENNTFRTTNLLSGETQRGKQHVGKAGSDRRYVYHSPASPVCMVRLICQTQVSSGLSIGPSQHIWSGDIGIHVYFWPAWKVLSDGRPVMNWFKETKGHLPILLRLPRVNTGSPTSREAHGDGVSIVVRAGEQVSQYMAKRNREHRELT
jgi:hypothetical protein